MSMALIRRIFLSATWLWRGAWPGRMVRRRGGENGAGGQGERTGSGRSCGKSVVIIMLLMPGNKDRLRTILGRAICRSSPIRQWWWMKPRSLLPRFVFDLRHIFARQRWGGFREGESFFQGVEKVAAPVRFLQRGKFHFFMIFSPGCREARRSQDWSQIQTQKVEWPRYETIKVFQMSRRVKYLVCCKEVVYGVWNDDTWVAGFFLHSWLWKWGDWWDWNTSRWRLCIFLIPSWLARHQGSGDTD